MDNQLAGAVFGAQARRDEKSKAKAASMKSVRAAMRTRISFILSYACRVRGVESRGAATSVRMRVVR